MLINVFLDPIPVMSRSNCGSGNMRPRMENTIFLWTLERISGKSAKLKVKVNGIVLEYYYTITCTVFEHPCTTWSAHTNWIASVSHANDLS